jgi:hypothetical protein
MLGPAPRDAPPGELDQFDVFAPMGGLPINGTTPDQLQINLGNPLGTVSFDDTQLPTTPPSLSSFGQSYWQLSFKDETLVQGDVSSLTAPVPLPPAAILFAAGLVALVGLGAWNWQQKKNTFG